MTADNERTDGDDASSASMRRVRWPEDLGTVKRLFGEYRLWLADHHDAATSSQSRVKAGLGLIDKLLSDLPGVYGPPRGDILLWFEQESVVACGALRELEPGIGEIKRIYVRADYRGKTFGHPFVQAMIARARELKYERVRVDTLPTMRSAIEFYQELGFRPIAAFWPHPAAGALFFEREVDW